MTDLEKRLNYISVWGAIVGVKALALGYILESPTITGWGYGVLTGDVALQMAIGGYEKTNDSESPNGESQ